MVAVIEVKREMELIIWSVAPVSIIHEWGWHEMEVCQEEKKKEYFGCKNIDSLWISAMELPSMDGIRQLVVVLEILLGWRAKGEVVKA